MTPFTGPDATSPRATGGSAGRAATADRWRQRGCASLDRTPRLCGLRCDPVRALKRRAGGGRRGEPAVRCDRDEPARHRSAARRDRRPLLRALAGAALRSAPRRIPTAGRLLPHRRSAAADRRRRAAGSRSRRAPDRGDGAGAARRGRAAAAAGRRSRLPADGDRLRPVPAGDRAEGRRRSRPVPGELRAGPAPDRPAARRARAHPRAGADRGSEPAVSDFVLEPTEEPEGPNILPILPLKETVVVPESMSPLAIGQERSVKLVEDVVSSDRRVALLTVRNSEAEPPAWDDLYEIGTAALVQKMIRVPDGTLRILVQGLKRIRIERRGGEGPSLAGEGVAVPGAGEG